MAVRRGSQRKMLAAKPENEIIVASEKTRAEANADLTHAKGEERARPKSKTSLAGIQKDLRTAQAEVKRERQARIKAEKALTEAQEDVAAAQLEAEQGRQAQVRRVSFIVRLTVDEHGQLGRAEIEDVQSSRRQNFLSFDGERLIAFMKACIGSEILPDHVVPAAPPPEKGEASTAETLRPKSSLIISNVRVFRPGKAAVMALILTPEEPFVVRARFQLQGPEAHSLTTQEPSCEMKVYANAVTSTKSKLLTTYTAKLIQDMLDYSTTAEVPGLPSGLYRLFTVVTVGSPIMIAGFHDEAIIHVI